MLAPSFHQDSFTRDNLPPTGQWPDLLMDGFAYPEELNIGVELTDAMVAKGLGIIPRSSAMGGGAPIKSWQTGATGWRMRWFLI